MRPPPLLSRSFVPRLTEKYHRRPHRFSVNEAGAADSSLAASSHPTYTSPASCSADHAECGLPARSCTTTRISSAGCEATTMNRQTHSVKLTLRRSGECMLHFPRAIELTQFRHTKCRFGSSARTPSAIARGPATEVEMQQRNCNAAICARIQRYAFDAVVFSVFLSAVYRRRRDIA